MLQLTKKLFAMLSILAATTLVTGCEVNVNESPTEDVTESINEGAEDVQEGVEETTEDLDDIE